MEGLAELHTHLGGSVSSDILWTLAHEQGIALPVKDYWDFDRLVTVSDPRGVPDLNALDQIYHWTELIQSSPIAVEVSVHAAIGRADRSHGTTTPRRRFTHTTRKVLAEGRDAATGARLSEHRVEHVVRCRRQIAHERLQRFLPLDLARVDVRLHVDDRTMQRFRLRRRRHLRARENEQRQHAPLGGAAELLAHEWDVVALERVDEGHHIGVRRRLGIRRPLGACVRKRCTRERLRRRAVRASDSGDEQCGRDRAYVPHGFTGRAAGVPRFCSTKLVSRVKRCVRELPPEIECVRDGYSIIWNCLFAASSLSIS